MFIYRNNVLCCLVMNTYGNSDYPTFIWHILILFFKQFDMMYDHIYHISDPLISNDVFTDSVLTLVFGGFRVTAPCSTLTSRPPILPTTNNLESAWEAPPPWAEGTLTALMSSYCLCLWAGCTPGLVRGGV